MAESRRTRSSGSSRSGSQEERGAVRRVVLRREQVIRLAETPTREQLDAIKRVAKEAGLTAVAIQEAWVVCGEFDGASKQQAIRAHAGRPGTPDAKPGAYRAPSVAAWKGGEELVRPDKPKVEAKPLD